MEKLNELQDVLLKLVDILELQALVSARKSDVPTVDESGRKLTAEERDRAVVGEYTAIRTQIRALR